MGAVQLILNALRAAGERATLLSGSDERDEAIIVARNIPESVKERIEKLAERIEYP